MYVQYKVNVSENQVDTLKDAIRVKKCQKVASCLAAYTSTNQSIGHGTIARETYTNSLEY